MTDTHASTHVPPSEPLDAPVFSLPRFVASAVARHLLGESPGVRAFATGLVWTTTGLLLQVVGLWLTTILPFSIVGTKFFFMVSTVFTAAMVLIILCGVMTMLAGAIRYGVGATDHG